MSIFVCGTDTGVGKTISSAALMQSYGPKGVRYWKPVQTGDDDDCATVQKLSGQPAGCFLPNLFSFPEPLSPHRAAELASSEVDVRALVRHFYDRAGEGPLIIEGAGGLLVPLTRQFTWLDFIRETGLPVLVIARTTLGTINHSMLTLEALRLNSVLVAGILFCGPENEDNVFTITQSSDAPLIGSYEWKPGTPLPDVDPGRRLANYLQ